MVAGDDNKDILLNNRRENYATQWYRSPPPIDSRHHTPNADGGNPIVREQHRHCRHSRSAIRGFGIGRR